MDIRRTIIIIGLAIVSYLMILQWNKDYAESQSNIKIENIDSSIPQSIVNINKKTKSQYIEIETDILKGLINLEGGDIEKLTLKYTLKIMVMNLTY